MPSFLKMTSTEYGLRTVDSSVISPDGKWIAYFPDKTGQGGLYIRAYPESDVSWLVPGTQQGAVWSPDGSELFHYDAREMIAVSVQMEPKFEASQPRPLFEGSYAYRFDVSPDGQRFLMMRKELAPPIHVVLNWFEELRRLVPTDN